MTDPKDIEIRSEEVQEILGTPPRWMVRWGTVVAFATFLVLGWMTYWIEYPDVVSKDIRITSTDPPKKLLAENSTYISHVLVENEDSVEAGRTLVVFSCKAEFSDVLTLEDELLSVKDLQDSVLLAFQPSTDLLLGELQDDYYDFIEKREELRMYTSNRYERYSIRQLERQISNIQRSINDERRRKAKLEEQFNLVNQRFYQEQNLFNEKLLPLSKLQQTKEDILALEREMQAIETAIKNKRFEIEAIRGQIGGVRQGTETDRYLAASALKESFIELQNAVEDWKKRYLIVAPVSGIVSFTNESLAENQAVSRGEELMVVAPTQQTDIVGRMDLDLEGSGRVKEGQRVVVKLSSYPYAEFGALIGRVAWKSRVPNDGVVTIEVGFDGPALTTTTGWSLELSQEMVGKADIITEDKRFIERIFERFRGIRG